MKKLSIALLLALAAVSQSPAKGQPVASACTDLTITNIKHQKGTIWLAFYGNENTFPNQGEQDFAKPFVTLKDSVQHMEVCGLKTGWYAIAVFQDMDNDQSLNTDAVGQPQEPYGFSNNAKYKGIAPSFKQCKVYIEAGKASTIDISLVNP